MILKGVVDFIKEIVQPVSGIIDEFHLSDEEKLRFKKAFLEMQTRASVEIAKYDLEITRIQTELIKAETATGNWLQKSWRPIMMLAFLGLVMLDAFCLLPKELNEHVWLLIQIGVGGYVAGRSGEKIVGLIKNNAKN